MALINLSGAQWLCKNGGGFKYEGALSYCLSAGWACQCLEDDALSSFYRLLRIKF